MVRVRMGIGVKEGVRWFHRLGFQTFCMFSAVGLGKDDFLSHQT